MENRLDSLLKEFGQSYLTEIDPDHELFDMEAFNLICEVYEPVILSKKLLNGGRYTSKNEERRDSDGKFLLSDAYFFFDDNSNLVSVSEKEMLNYLKDYIVDIKGFEKFVEEEC